MSIYGTSAFLACITAMDLSTFLSASCGPLTLEVAAILIQISPLHRVPSVGVPQHRPIAQVSLSLSLSHTHTHTHTHTLSLSLSLAFFFIFTIFSCFGFLSLLFFF